MTESRRRGRPAGGGGDRRARILQAARSQFASEGFAGASLRSIAADAGVDPALVSHYFGTKAGLLAATLDVPFDPAERIATALDGDGDGAGERLLTTFLGSWDAHPQVFATVVRSALAGPGPVAGLARDVIAGAIRERLDGPDADLRAGLIASQVIGLGIQRWVLELGPVATTPAEDVVRWYAPSLQRLISPG